jgi:hypothetical protein
VHHPEQPALPRVIDDGVRLEPTLSGNTDVPRRTKLVVDIRRCGIEFEQRVERQRVRQPRKPIAFGWSGSEGGAPQEVFDCR